MVLVFGEHLGETVGLFDGLSHSVVSSFFRVAQTGGIENIGPMSAFWRFPWRWPALARTILTFTPIARAVAMVALASSLADRIEATRLKTALTVSVVPRDAQGAKATRGESLTLSNGWLHLPCIG